MMAKMMVITAVVGRVLRCEVCVWCIGVWCVRCSVALVESSVPLPAGVSTSLQRKEGREVR